MNIISLKGKKPFQKITDVNEFQELYKFIEKFKEYEDQVIISIILPLFNEEKTIRGVLESLPNHKSIEVIVVNDKSTDNSLEEIKLVQSYRNIKLINHQINKGYGAAIMTGIKHAKGKVIVSMDSDGQHSPDDLFTLVKPILDERADYTIGSRYLGTYFYQLPLSTRLGELFVEKLIRIFFGKKIMNNQNGFRAFNKKILPIFNDLKYYGYAFCTEQILKTSLEGYKIKECPIKVYNRKYGTSHIILSKLAINMVTLFFNYLIKKIKITVLKRDKSGILKIYEKSLKRKEDLFRLRYKKENTYLNSIVFIERRYAIT
ncbi:MAG: glycosyltransferase family 2 protein [Candidatus Hermodarchaeota archaeon]